jgi:hypothetical protein
VDEQTAGTRDPRPHPRRHRRWANPLTRTSDSVEDVARLVVLLLLVATVPLAVVAGAAVHARVQQTADAERTARSLVAATVLADAIPGRPPAGAFSGPAAEATGAALAGWQGPGGYRQARVTVPIGSRTGTDVRIWVDRAGNPAAAPTGDGDVAADAMAAGVLTASGLAGAAVLGHLLVGRLLRRSRLRR